MRKIISLLTAALLLIISVSGAVLTEENLSDKQAVQDFADTYMCENAGVTSEWFAFALAESDCDFSKYISSLDKYISENPPSAVTSLKYALVYRALGVDKAYTKQTVQGITDSKSVMYVIFALHLLNNGLECDSATAPELAEKLVGLQNSDGGWSVIKGNSDVDTTAMALQALAHHGDKHGESIEKAIKFLSDVQIDTAGFKSYGAENAESAAQVIISLSDIGIDCRTDERFIKNGKNIFDFLKNFKKQNGYSHTADADASDLATSQVLCAFSAYERFKNGKSPFYIFDFEDVMPEETEADNVTNTSESENVSDITDAKKENAPAWRYIFIGIILFAGVVCCVLLILFKKTKTQNFIFIFVICAVAAGLSFFVDFSSADNYYKTETPDGEAVGTVTFSVTAEEIGKGEILSKTDIPIYENETVYDVLIRAGKEYELVIGKSGTGTYAYIQSINGISELQHGELSGWIYTVNGEQPSVGCGTYTPSDGDTVEFLYTLDLKLN